MFTDTLLSAIRLQRHLGARIVICTQEPTVSPALLDLCSVTIVHRFTSPEWLRALYKHLAAASNTDKPKIQSVELENDCVKDDPTSIFNQIVSLRVGEALLFAPSAVVDTAVHEDGEIAFRRLGVGFLHVKIRERLTLDGGKSVLSR